MDHRSRYSKMIIERSFLKLLHEKPFHKIHLTELCGTAEINRSTFYKYYRDTYDWRDSIDGEIMSHAQTLVAEFDTHDFYTVIKRLLQAIKGNLEFITVVFSENWESDTLERVISVCLEKTGVMKDNVPPGKQLDYNFILYGCMGVIRHWLNNGADMTAESVAEYMAKMIKTILG